MKRKLSIILSITMLVSCLSFTAYGRQNEGRLKWPGKSMDEYVSGKTKVWYPKDGYTNMQNPPDFIWTPVTESVDYDLIVCKDKELNDVKYHKENIKYHFYNFKEPFLPGTYYFSVKYNTESSSSVWSEPRKFRVDEDAYIPDPYDEKTLKEKIKKLKRPVYYNKEIMERRFSIPEGKSYYNLQKSIIKKAMDEHVEVNTDYEYKYNDGGLIGNNNFWVEIRKASDPLKAGCYVFATYKEKDVLDFCIEKITELSKFRLPPYDPLNDSQYGDLCFNLSIGYDTFYKYMSKELRESVLKQINIISDEGIGKTLYEKRGQSSYEIDPSASHQWGTGVDLIRTAVIVGEGLNVYDRVIDFLLPLYINIGNNHGYEDGTYQGGIGYWRYKDNYDLWIELKEMGIYDATKCPGIRNFIWQGLYMWPTNEVGVFGDDSYHKPDMYYADRLKKDIALYKNPYSKWMFDEINISAPGVLYNIDDVKAKAPIDIPRSRYFKDTGFVGLHSDLTDPLRVSLYFRSSWWGSFNHSHADQNSFCINAYGEALAIDSGFYPYYNSPHHENYSRRTHAHNAITYNGGKGQITQDIEAEGKITDYINHSKFDLVSGDATNAYKEGRGVRPNTLSKVKRDIIYLRPDTFVVIDDLKAKDGEVASFEFWLNSWEGLSLYKNANGARIEKGKAVLDASFIYPKDLKGRYLKGFTGPDMINYKKEKGANAENNIDPDQPDQRRVYFATKPVNETKIITVLDVHKKDYPAQYVQRKINDSCVELAFEDGSKCYINLKNDKNFKFNNIVTDAGAVVIKDNSYLILKATYLKKDGKPLMESDNIISCAIGDGLLNISTIENESNVKIYNGKTNKVVNVYETLTREIKENEEKHGILWSNKDNYTFYKLYNGTYEFYINGRNLPGTLYGKSSMKFSLDGIEKDIPSDTYFNHDNEINGKCNVNNLKGFYKINDMKDVSVTNSHNVLNISGNLFVNIRGENPYLNISKIRDPEVIFYDDFNKMKEEADAFAEAEDFIEKSGSSTVEDEPVYKFLSGKKILQNMQGLGEEAVYEINIKEEGDYDILLSNVVYNTETPANIMVETEGNIAVATMPVTNGPKGPNILKGTPVWGITEKDWHVARIKSFIHLKKGKIRVSVIGLGGGNMKLDYLGFIKSSK